MKRRDLLKMLKNAGLTLREGGAHTKVLRDGIVVTIVPRHKEINEITAKIILKDAGLENA